MARAAADLENRGEAVTSRALAAAAHISLKHACTWLRQRETGMSAAEPLLSVLQYSSHSSSDNISDACAAANTTASAGSPAMALNPPDSGRQKD
jgi:hypothetical protein